jgi:hypothetical protein
VRTKDFVESSIYLFYIYLSIKIDSLTVLLKKLQLCSLTVLPSGGENALVLYATWCLFNRGCREHVIYFSSLCAFYIEEKLSSISQLVVSSLFAKFQYFLNAQLQLQLDTDICVEI